MIVAGREGSRAKLSWRRNDIRAVVSSAKVCRCGTNRPGWSVRQTTHSSVAFGSAISPVIFRANTVIPDFSAAMSVRSSTLVIFARTIRSSETFFAHWSLANPTYLGNCTASQLPSRPDAATTLSFSAPSAKSREDLTSRALRMFPPGVPWSLNRREISRPSPSLERSSLSGVACPTSSSRICFSRSEIWPRTLTFWSSATLPESNADLSSLIFNCSGARRSVPVSAILSPICPTLPPAVSARKSPPPMNSAPVLKRASVATRPVSSGLAAAVAATRAASSGAKVATASRPPRVKTFPPLAAKLVTPLSKAGISERSLSAAAPSPRGETNCDAIPPTKLFCRKTSAPGVGSAPRTNSGIEDSADWRKPPM